MPGLRLNTGTGGKCFLIYELKKTASDLILSTACSSNFNEIRKIILKHLPVLQFEPILADILQTGVKVGYIVIQSVQKQIYREDLVIADRLFFHADADLGE